MICFPQMASPVTNRRANKYINLVGQFDRQSTARSLLVEAPGRSSKREIPQGATESGGEAESLVEQSGQASVIDLAKSPIASQPCPSRGVSYLCIFNGPDLSLTSLPCAAARKKYSRKRDQR